MLNVLSLFDGMSCGRIALDKANIPVNKYYASEIDKWAIKVSKKNYPNIEQLGDVSDIDGSSLDVDLLIGGSPCQSFSSAGHGKGFDDPRGKLFWQYVRLLEQTKPKWFLLENVTMKQEHQDVITEALGVEPILINSDLFTQQNRKRLYWTNIPIEALPERPEWVGDFYQWRRTYFRSNKSGVCPCLTANMGSGGHNVPLKSKDLQDKLTPEECEVLQTVPIGYTEGVSNTQRYKMLGNGWTVDVIAHIFKGLKESDYAL